MMKDFTAGVKKAYVEKADDGSEHFYVEATISGIKEDRDGEAMHPDAILDMISQLKSKSIPFFPDHGKNSNGQQIYAWKDMMGVWTDGWIEGDNLKAKVRLNRANPDAMTFYKYAQEGMPLGFSIGGQVVEMSEEDIQLSGEESIDVEKPFADYKNFADCVKKNQGKEDPEGYCATIMRRVEDDKEKA